MLGAGFSVCTCLTPVYVRACVCVASVLVFNLSLMLCCIYRRWIFKDDGIFTAASFRDALRVAG